MRKDNLKIAIVYDWIDKWGGVERLLTVLHEMYPRAPFFTSIADTEKAAWARGIPLKTSFIQKAPGFIRKSRLLSFFLYPFAFESFDFSGYDVVISVTSSFAKAVVTKPGTFHLCILLTPTRYIWLYPSHYVNRAVRALARPFFSYIRKWDKTASARPDRYISISGEVEERCRRIYQRDSQVLYPPFDLPYWTKVKESLGPREMKLPFGDRDYFLLVSRLEPYKKADLAVEAFNREPGRRLVVVGKGSLSSRLRRKAKANIRFLEDLSDAQLGYLYSRANALIMPQFEDFGYTALEAQFFGCPVIAYGQGGVRETVRDGETGLFFPEQSAAGLRGVLERYDKISYNLKHQTKTWAAHTAPSFSKELFKKTLARIIINSVPGQNNQTV